MARMGQAYVEVTPDTDGFAAMLRAQLGRIRGDRDGRNVGETIGAGMLAGITSALGKKGAVAGAVVSMAAPLASALSGTAAAATGLASSLAYAASVGAAMPSMFAAMAQSVVAVKVGTMGMSEAFKASAKAQQEMAEKGEVTAATQAKLDAALQSLAPSARAFVKEVIRLAPAWSGVRKAVQGALFANLAGVFRDLSQSYLPVVQKGLTGTATLLNGLVQRFTDMATSAAWIKDMGTLMASNNVILGNFGSAALMLADGLRHLFVGIAPSVEKMSSSLVGAATAFRDWAAGKRQTGAIGAFMDKAVASFKIWWRLIKNVGKALGAIFGAGNKSGNEMVQMLADLAGKWAKWAQSTEGQQKLKKWFDEGVQVFRELGRIVRDIAKAFSGLAGKVDASTLISQIRTDVIDPLLDMVDTINSTGLGTSLITTIGQLAEAMSTIVKVTAPVANAVFSILNPILELINSSPAATSAIKTFLKSFAPIGLIRNVQTAIDNIKSSLPIFGGQAQAAMKRVTTAFKWVVNGAKWLWHVLFGGSIFPDILNALRGFFRAWSVLFRGAVAVIRSIVRGIRAAWPVVTKIISGPLKAAAAVAKAIFRGLRSYISTVVRLIKAVLSGNFKAIPGIIKGALGQLGGIARSAFNAVVSAAKSIVGKLGSAAREAGRAALDALRGMVSSFKSIGSDIIAGIGEGITAAAGGLAQKAADAARKALKAAKDFLKIGSPSRLFATQVGVPISQGVGVGILKAARRLNPGPAYAALGADMSAGLISGLANSANAASAILGDLTPATLGFNGHISASAALDTSQADTDQPVEIRVYVGDKEITDIVKTEIRDHAGNVVRRVQRGRRLV